MNEVELNETGYAFVWMGRVVWHRRWKAIRWALRNLWNALCGYELSLQWDPEKMGDTREEAEAAAVKLAMQRVRCRLLLAGRITHETVLENTQDARRVLQDGLHQKDRMEPATPQGLPEQHDVPGVQAQI